MLRHKVSKHTLEFKQPSGTSRGVLKTKDSWFIEVWDVRYPDTIGIGECSIIKGLSPDPIDQIEEELQSLSWDDQGLMSKSKKVIQSFPAIQFAVEMALLDLQNGGNRILFPSKFTDGLQHIDINGLIWMGELSFMKAQIKEKIEQGFRCVKLKIGAIDFEAELSILEGIRKQFSADDIELRVDANGAFHKDEALEKLKRLYEYDLHSIEQPIRQGQIDAMSHLCQLSPLAIALDEELIAVRNTNERENLITTIHPQYIILKPSLVGGLSHAQEWINIAEQQKVGWWITSALESNIGLNAIAQWTAILDTDMYQGLGTGGLYTNNIAAPLYLTGDQLFYNKEGHWGALS